MAISRKEEGTMSYSYRIHSRVLYSAQCHRHHCTLHAFEQFRGLYRHNLDDEHSTRPGFEPSSSKVSSHRRIEWAIGTASLIQTQKTYWGFYYCCIYIHMINRVWNLPSDPTGSGVIPCIRPLCPHMRCEILSRTLRA